MLLPNIWHEKHSFICHLVPSNRQRTDRLCKVTIAILDRWAKSTPYPPWTTVAPFDFSWDLEGLADFCVNHNMRQCSMQQPHCPPDLGIYKLNLRSMECWRQHQTCAMYIYICLCGHRLARSQSKDQTKQTKWQASDWAWWVLTPPPPLASCLALKHSWYCHPLSVKVLVHILQTSGTLRVNKGSG